MFRPIGHAALAIRPLPILYQHGKGDPMDDHPNIDEHSKAQQLATFGEYPAEQYLTTDQGLRISDTDNSLHGGQRGPTLLEDFHLREKITHFDHERIPER